MNMATFMEDADSKSRSQNRLQDIDVDDPAHEQEGTMVTLERPGPQTNRFHNGKMFLSCYSNVFLNYWCGF